MYISQDTHPKARVNQLIAMYGGNHASAAHLLCDRHDPTTVAYQIVDADLSLATITYAELRTESERFAAALHAQGIRQGDRVATLMGKSRALLVALVGIWRLGAVHVPLFTAFAPAAIAMRLDASGARAVICDHAQHSKLHGNEDMPANAPWITVVAGAEPGAVVAGGLRFEDLMARDHPAVEAAALGADAPLIHIYTSGTTGKPKGVIVPLKALASFHAYVEFGIGLRADDVYWCAADPGWAYGLYFGVLGSLTTGVRSVLLGAAFSAETTYGTLLLCGVTNFAAAPTVYRSLRVSGMPVPAGLRLRCLSSAGEPLTPEVNEWAIGALGMPVGDHFGQTETGMLINNHHHPILKQDIVPGSMGVAMPGWKAAVLDQDADRPAPNGVVGRMAIDLSASPLAWFGGYLNDAEKSAEKFSADGRWYLTGDAGRIDSDGYCYFSARDDDVIIMAGYRIGPFDVESIIVTHEGVSECAVIAVPDAVRGEVIEAFVVLRDGVSPTPALASELQQWVKTKFAAHAYPRTVHFVDGLPKTPSGKVQRFALRNRRREELAHA
ncbi:AMP-binding protein [Rugamonas apoptosis]|uniref:AMP-binding protein n=1 Tax=Rugamonas apoptosis TaxID=2758570 RepID=A0A7W2IMX7_9BURK|nr:AMP-binding protein [Rugamonas apoptosis]MBA5689957.1 AMP-binding protein [Rugamonas apoptosis]